MLKVLFLSKIYPGCHLDVNRVKPGSNSIMTDKHTDEHSKTACLDMSRILILLAILLYEQYIRHTQASICPNMQFLSAQQYAYQSLLSYFLV